MESLFERLYLEWFLYFGVGHLQVGTQQGWQTLYTTLEYSQAVSHAINVTIQVERFLASLHFSLFLQLIGMLFKWVIIKKTSM
jgi:hypothetical protein